MASAAPRFLANGNISPSTVVKVDSSVAGGFMVINATAVTDKVIGIAQEGTYNPPGVNGSDGYAAHQGQPVNVFGDGEECLAVASTGATINPGDALTVDASSNVKSIAFTSGSGTVWQVARALQGVTSATAGTKIRVLVACIPIEGITA